MPSPSPLSPSPSPSSPSPSPSSHRHLHNHVLCLRSVLSYRKSRRRDHHPHAFTIAVVTFTIAVVTPSPSQSRSFSPIGNKLSEVTFQTPCGHNFCLKCFENWVGQGKHTCAICRATIPPKMASQPLINSSLVIAIRMAKLTKSNAAAGPPKPYYSVLNQNI